MKIIILVALIPIVWGFFTSQSTDSERQKIYLNKLTGRYFTYLEKPSDDKTAVLEVFPIAPYPPIKIVKKPTLEEVKRIPKQVKEIFYRMIVSGILYFYSRYYPRNTQLEDEQTEDVMSRVQQQNYTQGNATNQSHTYDYNTPDVTYAYDYNTPDLTYAYDHNTPDVTYAYEHNTPDVTYAYEHNTPDLTYAYKYPYINTDIGNEAQTHQEKRSGKIMWPSERRKRDTGRRQTSEDEQVTQYWQTILKYDKQECVKRLVCEMEVETPHTMTPEEQGVYHLIHMGDQATMSEAQKSYIRAMKLGETKGQEHCSKYFPLCPRSAKEMFNTLRSIVTSIIESYQTTT